MAAQDAAVANSGAVPLAHFGCIQKRGCPVCMPVGRTESILSNLKGGTQTQDLQLPPIVDHGCCTKNVESSTFEEFLLPTAYCLLCIAYCLLPTAYSPLCILVEHLSQWWSTTSSNIFKYGA
jgi:hypothetical protein